MAKKRYRYETLTPEQQGKIYDLSGSYSWAREEFLDAVETGKLDEFFEKQGQPTPGFKAQLDAAMAPLPTRQTAIRSYIDAQKDIPNLTTADLIERKSIFEELSKIPGERTLGRDRQIQNMMAQIGPAFLSQGVAIPDDLLKQISEYAIDSLKAGKYDPQQVVNFIGDAGKGREEKAGLFGGREEGQNLRVARSIGEDIPKIYTTQVQSGQFEDVAGTLPDYSADITTIEDILADRSRREAAGAEITSFFELSKSETDTARQNFFNQLRTKAEDFVGREYAPGVTERLRARGLSRSGQVADAVTSKYAQLFGEISESEANQLQSDIDFFNQQEYDKTFGDLVDAGKGITGTIASERERLRSEQIVGFGKQQAEIEKSFDFDLFKQQAQSAYDTYQKQVSAQTKQSKSQQEADLISGAAGAVTTVALASLL